MLATRATAVAPFGHRPKQLVATTRGLGALLRKPCLMARKSAPPLNFFGPFLRFLHALHTSTTACQAGSEKRKEAHSSSSAVAMKDSVAQRDD